MKKMLCIMLCLGFLLSGCSSNNSEKISIKASMFSKETQNALFPFRDEIQYFDISFDDTAKSYIFTVWTSKDGVWQEVVSSRNGGELTEAIAMRVAIKWSNEQCTFYTSPMDGGVFTTYETAEFNAGFDDKMNGGSIILGEEKPMELNKEVTILAKYSNLQEGANITSDNFRDIECDAGLAITLTVLDTPLAL